MENLKPQETNVEENPEDFECGQRFTDEFLRESVNEMLISDSAVKPNVSVTEDPASGSSTLSKSEFPVADFNERGVYVSKCTLLDSPTKSESGEFADVNISPDDFSTGGASNSSSTDQQDGSDGIDSDDLKSPEDSPIWYKSCGRPPVPKTFFPADFLEKNKDHPFMVPHATRKISKEAHFCPCCNHPIPNIYECSVCHQFLLVTHIDMHEAKCSKE